jgi:hypothetical protein
MKRASRQSWIEHRPAFLRGAAIGMILVIVKYAIVLPIDIADILYGSCLLVTLIITLGDLLGLRFFAIQSVALDFILGLLYPLDAYAVLILFGLPLPD